MNLILTRPLVVIDLETTGTDTKTARIVELTAAKRDPGAESTDIRTRRLNPGVSIPAEAIAVHGISDAMVADCLPFGAIARGLLDFLDGCDLAGFNLKRFDLKVLCNEFARCGLEFSIAGRSIIDVCEIFHQRQPRTLEAAVMFYLGCNDFAAHSSAGDVMATAEVLDAMLVRYDDLPRDAAKLAEAFIGDALDLDEFFIRRGTEIVFAKGKHAGKPISSEPGYLRWMLDQDFYPDTKSLVRSALSTSKE